MQNIYLKRIDFSNIYHRMFVAEFQTSIQTLNTDFTKYHNKYINTRHMITNFYRNNINNITIIIHTLCTWE